MSETDCGCRIIFGPIENPSLSILFCPLHAAAEQMLAACEAMLPVVCDAIMHGMPITKSVAEARNKGAEVLGKLGSDR